MTLDGFEATYETSETVTGEKTPGKRLAGNARDGPERRATGRWNSNDENSWSSQGMFEASLASSLRGWMIRLRENPKSRITCLPALPCRLAQSKAASLNDGEDLYENEVSLEKRGEWTKDPSAFVYLVRRRACQTTGQGQHWRSPISLLVILAVEPDAARRM